jgi:hypothetical protein
MHAARFPGTVQDGRRTGMANEKPCDFCKGRAYTKKPVTIITAYGKRFQMVFEYCPNCGRKLRKESGGNEV